MPRRWVDPFIGLWLLSQLVIPMRYYLGNDTTDERFAWRMFSARRMQPCEWALLTRAGANDPWHSVDLDDIAHSAWADRLMRGQRVVVESFLTRLCDRGGAASARFTLTCRPLDGAPTSEQVERVCATGRTTSEAR